MNKNIYFTTYIIIATLSLVACDKFLDVKPAGKLTPEKGDVIAFDRLLNNSATISSTFQRANDGTTPLTYLTNNIEVSDNQANYSWGSGTGNTELFFAHIFQLPYGNPGSMDESWNNGVYRAAEYFNIVIDGVNEVRTPEVERQANETIAQATVARAWGYFFASLGYGPVYKPGGDNSRKVLPYRTASSVMAPMEELSTMQEIFDRVLSEVHGVLRHIPEMASSNTRFGKAQTYAFLAEYHLFTHKFDSVAYYSDKALELAAAQQGGLENLFFDMNQFSWSNQAAVDENPDLRVGNNATIVSPQGQVTETMHRENCLYRAPTLGGVSGAMSYPTAEFLALFESTDLRTEYYIFEYISTVPNIPAGVPNDGRRVQNYQTKFGRTNGYSYPELLLMRAESRARTGNTSGALSDLNYLRRFRHTPDALPLNITNPDALVQEVLNERRRELAAASPKHCFDLKRLCLDSGKPWGKTSVTHTVKGVPYTADIDSEYFILPIKNPILKYNPQWGISLDSRPWSSVP